MQGRRLEVSESSKPKGTRTQIRCSMKPQTIKKALKQGKNAWRLILAL
jgi:hypothetical protein